LFNFLALLGWALDDKTELFTREELVQVFTLERVGKTAAVFNKPKLDWMNGTYIRALSADEFAQRAVPYLERDLPPEAPRPLDAAYLRSVTALVQERVKLLSELGELCGFFFLETLSYPAAELVAKGMDAAGTLAALRAARHELEAVDAWHAAALETVIRPMCESLELSPKQLFGVLRVAVTGRTAAPPLFDTMEVLGKTRSVKRLADAEALIEGDAGRRTGK